MQPVAGCQGLFRQLTGSMSCLQAGRHFCAKSWLQVQQERGGELMLENYCFRYGLWLLVPAACVSVVNSSCTGC